MPFAARAAPRNQRAAEEIGDETTLARGPATAAIVAGVHAVDLDRGFYDVKLGAKARYTAGALAITAGSGGNLPVGTVLRWTSPPAGLASTVTLTTALSDGFDVETNVALALRMSARQRSRRQRQRDGGKSASRGGKAGPVIALAQARAAAPAVPAEPLTPEQAHKAKLAALQAMLALGDAKAERAAKSGKMHFADTEPVDDDYANTQFVERADSSREISLLDLDRVPGSSTRTGR